MGLEEMISAVKRHPDFARVGMILCHQGVVRGHSRSGVPVRGVTVTVDRGRLEETVRRVKALPGIVEVMAHVREGYLAVGEDVMYVVVAGDYRENCFAALREAVETIKAHVTSKEEHPR